MTKKDTDHKEMVTPEENTNEAVMTPVSPETPEPTKTQKGLGNSGSITGNSHTADTHTETMPQPVKTSWWQRLSGYIGIFVLLGIGIFYVFSVINTPPIAVNPTDEPVTFEIDGSGVTLPAGGYQKLHIKHGKHTVTAGGKELGTFEYGWFDEDSVLNPTLSPFVVADILYATSDAYQDKLNMRTITIEGEEVEGPYTLIEPALYIKKSWDYDQFNNKSPTTVRIKGNYTIKQELFSIPQFIDAYNNAEI